MSDDFIRVLAEQAYRYHLLVKALRVSGHLPPQEPDSLWNAGEFEKFLEDFQGNYFPASLRRSGES